MFGIEILKNLMGLGIFVTISTEYFIYFKNALLFIINYNCLKIHMQRGHFALFYKQYNK